MNVPKLRFKEFSGEWKVTKLGDVCEFTQGIQLPSSEQIDEYKEGYIRYLYIRDFFSDNMPCYVKNIYTNKIIKSNEIMIVNTGNTAGKAYMGVTGVLSNNAFKVSFNHELIDNNFIFNTLISDSTQNKIQSFFNLSGQPHLGHKNIALVPFKFPSLPEQTRIANFLTAIDEKISQLTQKHDLLKQYKKGVMQQIFSQKLRFKDEDGREFPEWEVKKLIEIGEIITGKTPSTTDIGLWNGDIQFVTPTDISYEKYQYRTQRTIATHGRLKVLPEKSIMFTCIASIGKMALSVYPCVTNQQINSLIPDSSYDNEYVYYAILSISEYIKSTQANTTLPIINKTEFSKFKIPVPSVIEQTKIANFLTAIDDKITHTKTQLDAVKLYKKGLLQQLFV